MASLPSPSGLGLLATMKSKRGAPAFPRLVVPTIRIRRVFSHCSPLRAPASGCMAFRPMAAVAAQNPATATIFPLALKRQFLAHQNCRGLRVLRSASASRRFGVSVMAPPSRPSRTAIATGAGAPTMESMMKAFGAPGETGKE